MRNPLSALRARLRRRRGGERLKLLQKHMEAQARAAAYATPVLESATQENFSPGRYLLANADVFKVFGADEAAAARHFQLHGHKEKRRQVSQAFFECRQDYMARKYALFKEALNDARIEAFPAAVGVQFTDIDDYASESSNGSSPPFNAESAAHPDRLYLEVGAGLQHQVFLNCAYIEIYPSLTADIIVEPKCELPFKTGSIDGIGCFAVLEHVDQPWKMAQEFARVIKPGGKIFIDWPFLQPVHGYPSHYFNATREGLRTIFAPWFDVKQLYTGPFEGPEYTLQWIAKAFLESLNEPALKKMFDELTIHQICQTPLDDPMWRRLTDVMDDAAISTLSCGNILIATRV